MKFWNIKAKTCLKAIIVNTDQYGHLQKFQKMMEQNNRSEHYYFLLLEDFFCLISKVDTASFWKEISFQTDGIHLNKKGKRSTDRSAWLLILSYESAVWIIWLTARQVIAKQGGYDASYFNNLLLNVSHWPCMELYDLSDFY